MITEKNLFSTKVIGWCVVGIVIVLIVGLLMNIFWNKPIVHLFDSETDLENRNIDVTKEGQQQTLTVGEGLSFLIGIILFVFTLLLFYGYSKGQAK